MQAKQMNQELDANFAIIQKAWRPAVLDTGLGNLTLIATYVAERHTVNGLVDLSAQHMSDAVNALTSVLKWKVAPKAQPTVQGLTKITNEVDHIIEANIEQAKENKRRGIAEAKRKEEEAVKKVLYACEQLCQSANRQTTAKKEQLRAALTEMFDAGLVNLKRNVSNKTHSQQMREAQALLAKLQAYADSDAHTPRGFLPQGWN